MFNQDEEKCHHAFKWKIMGFILKQVNRNYGEGFVWGKFHGGEELFSKGVVHEYRHRINYLKG